MFECVIHEFVCVFMSFDVQLGKGVSAELFLAATEETCASPCYRLGRFGVVVFLGWVPFHPTAGKSPCVLGLFHVCGNRVCSSRQASLELVNKWLKS